MRSVAVLAIVLLAPLLALGAVGDLGLLLATLLTASWAGYVSWLRARTPTARSVRLAQITLWGAVGYIAFQLIPLPQAIVAFLSPRAAEVWSRAGQLLGQPLAFHLTTDPPATVFALVTAAVVALAYSASVRYAADKEARMRLLYAVVVVVLVMDLIGLGHRVFGADRVYGFYVPRYPGGHGFLSPLLNPNHAAALACIAPPILITMGLEAQTQTRTLLAIGVVVSGAVALLTLSRSGMLVLALELGATLVYTLRHGRRLSGRGTRIAATVLAVVGVAIAALVVSSESIVREATNRDVSKLRVPLRAFALISDFSAVGVGRGAFGSTFPRYEMPLPPDVRYLYVENWPVQLLADFGVIPALAYVGALGAVALSVSKRVLERPAYVGALIALCGLLVHDLFDFSMEFAGVGMVAAVLLAVVTTAGVRRERDKQPQGRLYLPAAAIACASIGGLLLRTHWSMRADDEQRALQQHIVEEPTRNFSPEIRAAIARHPADPHFYALEGIRRIHESDAGRFLARSIELGPDRAATHVWFARWLAMTGRRGQCWSELRQAATVNPRYAASAASEMVRLGADLDELTALVRSESVANLVVPLLDARKRGDDADVLDTYVIETFPPAVDARLRQIERAKRKNDLARARSLAEALTTAAPGDARSWLLAASLASTDEKAEEYLAMGLRRVGKDTRLLEEVVRRHGVRLGLQAIGGELQDLQTALDREGASPSRLPLLKAQIELARGNSFNAVRYYLDAWKAVPENVGYLQNAAELAERTGQTNYAVALWERLQGLRPDDPVYRDRIRQLRASAPASAVPVVSAVPSLFPPIP